MVIRSIVQFNRRDFASFGEQGVGEDARTRADFEHVVFNIDLRPFNGAFQHVVVDKKMLTKGFGHRLFGA